MPEKNLGHKILDYISNINSEAYAEIMKQLIVIDPSIVQELGKRIKVEEPISVCDQLLNLKQLLTEDQYLDISKNITKIMKG